MDGSRKALSGAMVALVAVLGAGCGGGGGGGGQGALVFAGVDLTVDARVPVSLTATSGSGSGVSAFSWSQTAGLDVDLVGASTAGLEFVAPALSTTLEFEVTGRRGDGSVAGRDRVIVQVQAARPNVTAPLLSAIDVRGGGPGRAISAALHRSSARLFVIDSVAGDVVCYDVSNPSSPSFAGTITAPAPSIGFTPGPPLDVACGEDGAVVVTWSGETLEFPGRMQFVDPVTLAELASISTTGAHPTDVDVSADGRLVAVACAADPPFVGGGDGRGYVTLVRVPNDGPGSIVLHSDVFPIVLASFDGNEAQLEQEGVRFFTSNPNASRELTPRSVAIAPDGSRVWAACPENDALIVIDAETQLVLDVLALDDRDFESFDGGVDANAERWTWSVAPEVLVTPAGDGVDFGGVTGIADVESLPGGDLALSVVTGAGPVLGTAIDRSGDGVPDLTFLDPDRQQAVTRVIAARDLGELSAGGEIALRAAGGAPVVGRPALFASSPGFGDHDEQAVDLDGNVLASAALGVRFGGATRGPGSDMWLADARRAGLWRFDAAGVLQARYVPSGTPAALGTATLPAVYRTRRANLVHPLGRRFGGFGGVAHHSGRGTIFAVTRLPLDNPDDASDATSLTSRIARVLEVQPSSGAVVGEYVLVLDAADHALEGLAYSDGPAFGGALALLESGPDADSFRGIHRLDLTSATNLTSLSSGNYAAVSAALESTAPADLSTLPVPVTPIAKSLRVDLTAAGLGGGGRPSGLAFEGDRVVVAFDDGLGLDGATVVGSTGRLSGTATTRGSIAVLDLTPMGIDASNGPGHARSPLPIMGMPQPLDLVAWSDGATQRLGMAYGGRPRVVPHMAGGQDQDERERLGDLVLDTSVFTNPFVLQSSGVAGELSVSNVGADTNGDMLVDRILAFGARGIGLHDQAGATLWRSSGDLVTRAHVARPGRVEAAAETFGIRPSSLAVATVGGTRVLVVGLQEAGLTAFFDLSNPSVPTLAGLVGAHQDPVDVDFAAIGAGVLVVTDRARGRIEVRRPQRN